MRDGRCPSILAWLLAAFFVFGGLGNILAPQAIVEDYRRWGYPAWFILSPARWS